MGGPKLKNQKPAVLAEITRRSDHVDALEDELHREREALYTYVLEAHDNEIAGATELARAAGWVRQRIYQLLSDRGD